LGSVYFRPLPPDGLEFLLLSVMYVHVMVLFVESNRWSPEKKKSNFSPFYFVKTVAAAQVITRLQLTWYGTPSSSISQVAIAFQTIVMIIVSYWSLRMFVFMIIASLDPNADPDTEIYTDPPDSYYFFAALDDLLFYIYMAFTVIVLRNVRSHLRHKCAIPESEVACTAGCEDVCCSLVCPCFAVAQMMRHTADYEVQAATCCSNTGLLKDVPAIV